MEKLIKEDYEILHYILELKTANKTDVNKMQNFIVKYIDNKCQVCPHCSGQIRWAHERIKSWYNKNKEIIEDEFN